MLNDCILHGPCVKYRMFSPYSKENGSFSQQYNEITRYSKFLWHNLILVPLKTKNLMNFAKLQSNPYILSTVNREF